MHAVQFKPLQTPWDKETYAKIFTLKKMLIYCHTNLHIHLMICLHITFHTELQTFVYKTSFHKTGLFHFSLFCLHVYVVHFSHICTKWTAVGHVSDNTYMYSNDVLLLLCIN